MTPREAALRAMLDRWDTAAATGERDSPSGFVAKLLDAVEAAGVSLKFTAPERAHREPPDPLHQEVGR